MTLRFSQIPGRHERHLKRKHQNPLFPEPEREISPTQLLDAQKRDHEELVEFIGKFRGLVQRAIQLKATEESQVVLELKEAFDRSYEEVSGLADDQSETKQAIVKLVGVMMNAVRSGTGGDAVALQELAQEAAARAAHFKLLEQPLVADILHPESPIGADELSATLLSESEEALSAALNLFDEAQLALIRREARELLDRLDEEDDRRSEAAERLEVIERALRSSPSGGASEP